MDNIFVANETVEECRLKIYDIVLIFNYSGGLS